LVAATDHVAADGFPEPPPLVRSPREQIQDEVRRQFVRIGATAGEQAEMLSRHGVYKVEDLTEGFARFLLRRIVPMPTKS
jgi:hypothetical protein